MKAPLLPRNIWETRKEEKDVLKMFVFFSFGGAAAASGAGAGAGAAGAL